MALPHLPPDVTAAVERLPLLVETMEQKAPYASASVFSESGIEISVSDREQNVSTMDPSQGAVLSAWNGAYFEEAACADLTPSALTRAAHALATSIHLATSPAPIEPGPRKEGHFQAAMRIDPASLSLKDKLDHCRDLHARVRKLDARIVNAVVRYQESSQWNAFADRSKRLSQQIPRPRIMVMLYVSDGQQMQYDWLIREGSGGFEYAQVSDEELSALCKNTVALRSATPVPPGMYDVVCTPDVSGVIAHEAFGHGVELDMFLKGRARSAQYLGKPIASPLVSILDDPSYPGAYGSYFFDDEGQLSSPTYIIRDGVFETPLSDLFSSQSMHMPHTANGRRESFQRKIYVRMSNTFFARGTTPVHELVESIEHGVFLQHTSSGMEDPKGWGMQVTCHYGEEIHNGKRTGKIFAPIGVTGDVPDILQSVSAVGDDFALSGGNCGKGHKEWVPVSSGGPHLKAKVRLG